MKKILILILVFSNILLAKEYSLKEEIKSFYIKPKYDIRLDIDSRAKGWYEIADVDEAGAFNIGIIYAKKIKDYKKAEYWLKKSYSMKSDSEILFNLALLYETIKKQMKIMIKIQH